MWIQIHWQKQPITRLAIRSTIAVSDVEPLSFPPASLSLLLRLISWTYFFLFFLNKMQMVSELDKAQDLYVQDHVKVQVKNIFKTIFKPFFVLHFILTCFVKLRYVQRFPFLSFANILRFFSFLPSEWIKFSKYFTLLHSCPWILRSIFLFFFVLQNNRMWYSTCWWYCWEI